MMTEEEKLNIYTKHKKSHYKNYAEDFVSEFLDVVYKEYELKDIKKTNDDSLFVEKMILKSMIVSENLEIKPQYLSLYTKNMNVKVIKTKNPTIIFDELFQFTINTFYMIVYSLINDKSERNITKCMDICISLLELHGNKHELLTYSYEKLVDLCTYPKNILDLAMDTYWVSWGFVIAHELYHFINEDSQSFYEEELDADKFAYKTTINMIEAQGKGKIPEDIQVFHNYLYLAPLMLLDYFKLLDYYNTLLKKVIDYTDYPTPEIRQEKLLDLFDDYIPDSFDTVLGNDIYNSFLDTIDFIKEQLIVKINKEF